MAAVYRRLAANRTSRIPGMSQRRKLFHLRMWEPDTPDAVDWEVEHHLQERVDELVASGHTESEARAEAERTFGDRQSVSRELRRLTARRKGRNRMHQALSDFRQDVQYGLRSIRLHPGLALGVVLTLALGIGANTAMFSVVDALLFRPLPYNDPDELTEVFVATPQSLYSRPIILLSVAEGWRAADVGPTIIHHRSTLLYTGGLEPRNLDVQVVTPEFEEVFEVSPLLGRGLQAEDARPGAPPVLILEYGFWQREFAGSPGVLGRAIVLDDVPHTIVGVMPEGFRFPIYAETSAWLPLRTGSETVAARPFVGVVTRIEEGQREVASSQAAAAGSALFREQNPTSESALSLRDLDWRRLPAVNVQRALVLLSAAVVLILLVAGVNMAHLLLTHSAGRTGEIAVRIALGASRLRLIRQIATEATLLALLGGLAAVLVAVLVLQVVRTALPHAITFLAPHEITFEQRTLLFTFLAALLTGLLFGLIPAFLTSDSGSAARAGLSRYHGTHRVNRLVRRVLAVSEIAITVILLIGAALLINSFVRLMRVDPGLELDNLAVLNLSVSNTDFETVEERHAYVNELRDELLRLPAVQGVSLSQGLPPHPYIFFAPVFETESSTAAIEQSTLPYLLIGEDFFEVTGARLVAGRFFIPTDRRQTGTAIIDEDLARSLWPGQSAIGQRFRLGPTEEWLTVVGVTADMLLLGPDERTAEFAMLLPLPAEDPLRGELNLAIRTRGRPEQHLATIRQTVREMNPNQAIGELIAAKASFGQAVDTPRFVALLMGILGFLALALAAVGIHGVLAFGVAQRRHELGIRLVLGGKPADLRWLVLREGMALAAIGVAFGVAGALAAGQLIRTALYGIEPVDTLTFVGVALLVMVVAVLATARPAWQATTVDPARVIRRA